MSGVFLLVETAEGETVAVRFPDTDAARDWDLAHEHEILVRGVVRPVSRTEALRLAHAPARWQ